VHFGDVLQLAHAHTGAVLVIDVSDKVGKTAPAMSRLSNMNAAALACWHRQQLVVWQKLCWHML
jgi:hypothetical protein